MYVLRPGTDDLVVSSLLSGKITWTSTVGGINECTISVLHDQRVCSTHFFRRGTGHENASAGLASIDKVVSTVFEGVGGHEF